MHAEEDRPRDEYGMLFLECCDGQIEEGLRDPSRCEPRCPWQQATSFTLRVWKIFCFCCSQTPATEKEPARYAIDVARWEPALRTYVVPQREWEMAWDWMHFICQVANEPDRERDVSERESLIVLDEE